MRRVIVAALLLLAPAALGAQQAPADAYADPVARRLVERARAARGEQGRSIRSYTATVKQRSAARLRTGLKDRMLGREESVARFRWSRDGETVVQIVAGRDQSPDGVEAETGIDRRMIFDPTSDRLYFGFGGDGRKQKEDEDFWVAHPLAEGSEAGYRYASGDSLTLRLPDGRTIHAVELRVRPRRPSWHYLDATLWIEPGSGALVRAAYRPSRDLDLERDTAFIDADDLDELGKVPGIFKPIQADLEVVVVEYSLWNLEHWLPRLVRLEGYARAGVLRMPFGDELSYTIHEVEDDGAPDTAEPAPEALVAAWADGTEMERSRSYDDDDDRRITVFVPEDRDALLDHPDLPPPIWEDAPEFVTEAELEGMIERLEAAVPRRAGAAPARYGWEWGLGGEDLVRYNRVEGLSVGARATADHALGRAGLAVRLGTADLHPGVELDAAHDGARRSYGLALYHRLDAVEGTRGALGFGNSMGALFLGRDDGQYFRATGARLSLTPPAAARDAWRLDLYAERQRPAERGTEWSIGKLLGGDGFRPNLDADDADLLGAALTLAPWWGSDPRGAQAGLEIFAEAATGDHDFARARLTARTAFPLFARLRAGLEAGAGTGWGARPVQHHWFLGGPESLRGYDGGAARGSDFVRARAELARTTGFGGLALFGDAGWAGGRDAFDADAALLSAGVGATFMDGLVRLDLARALRAPVGWRVEMYLDALL